MKFNSVSKSVTAVGAFVFGLATLASIVMILFKEVQKHSDDAQKRQESSLVAAATIWDAASPQISARFGADGAPTRIEWTAAPEISSHSLVDRIGAITGETTTLFVLDPATGEFMRRTTNIVKPDGTRAVGTKLGKAGAVHPVMASGRVFRGEATILGRDYATIYFPVHGPSGVEGILYVGVASDQIWSNALTETAFLAVAPLLGLLVGCVVLSFAARRSLGGLERVRAALSALSAGEPVGPLAEAERRDEIGELARAVGAYQAAVAEAERAKADAAARDEAAQRERERMMSRLETEIGGVVTAAAQGDLSRRIETRFDEPVLESLARNVNQFASAVDAGVSEMNRVARHMADGDLTQNMTGDFSGAFAELQTSINSSVSRLSELVGDIQGAAGSIQGSTDRLAASASELASRTESQASSLEETSATMEEMTATIKANAEHAEQAGALSSEAAARASRGAAVVDETVSAMGRIEAGSSKISDIISVIDGIAFQTNLLALNAAVEAARAGDAGKGFAVVASEVRTLAQRSAEAAKDIKTLIVESTGQVSEGVQLVHRTGASLKEIIESVEKVAATVEEISTATREQSAGVQEVSASISSMDEMTQQNSSMAEESASASRNLSGEGARLAELVRFFRVTGGGAPERRADAAWMATASAAAPEAGAPALDVAAPMAPRPQRQAAGGDDWSEF